MTAPQEEWGPWIDHDGKGCPCVGQVVMAERVSGNVEAPFIAGAGCMSMFGAVDVPGSAWVWDQRDGFTTDWFIRYRIRKPRALLDLIQLIADLPAPVKTDGVIA